MAKKFVSLITEKGKTLIAAAIAGGDSIKLKYFAVGDGNGAPVSPTSDQTALVNEVAHVEINSLKETDTTKQIVTAEAIIPAATGGFWMREAGVFTEDGTLLAVSQMPETYKPDAADGATSTQIVRMLLAVSDTSVVNLTVDDSTVTATEDYVNSQLEAHEKSRNHPDGTLKDKGFVQLSSATDSDSETLAATPKAVKAANENADSRLKADKNLSDVDDTDRALSNIKAYPLAGGEVKGEVWSEAVNNYRIVCTNKAAFWRFDDSNYYLMFTRDGDLHGGYSDLRPLSADSETGDLSTGHNFRAAGFISEAGQRVYSPNNCPFPVGYVMLMGNDTDPNTLFNGTTWKNMSESYDTRVIAIGTIPGTTGGSNSVTLQSAHLPDHSHQGGVGGGGAKYADFNVGTDNQGNYGATFTAGTYTDSQSGQSVSNEAFSVQNEYVQFRCWMRTG